MGSLYDKKMTSMVYEARALVSRYFYGEDLVIKRENNVSLEAVQTNPRYRSDRIESEALNKCYVRVKGLPIMRVSKRPDKAIFYMNVINLSSDTKYIGNRLLQDVEKYMQGIKIVRNISNFQNYELPSNWATGSDNNDVPPREDTNLTVPFSPRITYNDIGAHLGSLSPFSPPEPNCGEGCQACRSLEQALIGIRGDNQNE